MEKKRRVQVQYVPLEVDVNEKDVLAFLNANGFTVKSLDELKADHGDVFTSLAVN